MNLPPAVDESCRSHHGYKAKTRKADKARANRRFRHKFDAIVRDIQSGAREWDDEGFEDLGNELSSWEIF